MTKDVSLYEFDIFINYWLDNYIFLKSHNAHVP